MREPDTVAGVSGHGSSDTDFIKREKGEKKPLCSRKERCMAGAVGVRARQDEEDPEMKRFFEESSKAYIAMVNGIPDEKDSDNLEKLIQFQVKE